MKPTIFLPGRRSIVVALASLMLAALVPSTVAAATRPIRFELQLGDSCISGYARDSASVSLVWRDSSGSIKEQATITSQDWGYWFYCSPDESSFVAVGDRIRASEGPRTHRLVVPELSLRLNRVRDIYRGTGPAGAIIKLNYGGGAFPAPDIVIQRARIRVGSNGKWSFRPGWDVIGGESAYVAWRNSNDDSVWAPGTAPFFVVTLGKPGFSGVGQPDQTVHMTLADATTLDVKATGAAATHPYHRQFSGRFLDQQGDPVNASAGDRVSADIAADAAWVVPQIEGAANAATDIVSGRCFDTGTSERLAQIRLFRGGVQRGWAVTDTEVDGSFEVDFPEIGFPDPANVKSGDRILVSCMQTNGDYAQLSFFTP